MLLDLGDADSPVPPVVLSLARTAPPRCGTTVLVAVDGPSGSGKTTFARRLCAELPAPAVHMDDLYPGWDGLAEGVALVTDLVLRPLARGEPAAYRRWDWVGGQWGDSAVVPPGRFLVLEGCGSSALPAGRFAAVRLWLQADPHVRMRRGVERDGEAFRPHWRRWARQEEAVFAADGTRERADVVIDTTGRL